MKKLILSALLAVFPLYITTAQTGVDDATATTIEELAYAKMSESGSMVYLGTKSDVVDKTRHSWNYWLTGNGWVIVFENGKIVWFYDKSNP